MTEESRSRTVPPPADDAEAARGFTLIEILFALAVVGLVAGIALPIASSVAEGLRLSGDARNLANSVSLAKLQASANFTQSRLYVDFGISGYHTELYNKTSATWVTQGGTRQLSSTAESFGFGAVGSAPPNTQSAIAEASACLDASGTAITNTACILFNSRGVPIDATGAPTGADALYITDGSAVYGVTVSATSLVHMWRTASISAATWTEE